MFLHSLHASLQAPPRYCRRSTHFANSQVRLQDGTEVDLQGPYQKISFIEKLEEIMNEKITSFDVDYLLDLSRRHNVQMTAPFSVARILDELASTFIEPLCVQPTFIIGIEAALTTC
jgi:lysyl-tRNA synthetase class II